MSGSRNAQLSASSSGAAADTDDAGRQIVALMAELQQREQLIETLTERLEEAAEQLDRVRRTGSDRQVRGGGGGGGFPPELVERQIAIFDAMEQSLIEWQDLQGAALLQRMDLRLEKLIDLLRGDGGGESADQYDQQASSGQYGSHYGAAHGGTQAASPDQAGSSRTAGDGSASNAAHSAAEVDSVSGDEPPLELLEPPPPVADDEQNPANLQAHLLARDEYIGYLIRQLRQRRPTPRIDWERLRECPAEFETRLKSLEQRLHSDLQREELALSLERAKLARERAELDKIRTRLEREIRQLGQPGQPAAPGKEARSEPEEPKSNTWRSLFGKK